MKFRIYVMDDVENNAEYQATYWFIIFQGCACGVFTENSFLASPEENRKHIAKIVMHGRKGKVNPINAVCITLEKRNPQNPEEDEYVIGGFNDLISFFRENGLWRC